MLEHHWSASETPFKWCFAFCGIWILSSHQLKKKKKRCQSWCFSVKVSSRGQRSRVQNFSAFHCLLIENSSQRCPSSCDKFSDILCQGHSERPKFTITFELRRAISSNNVVFWQVQTQISLLNSNFGQYLNHSMRRLVWAFAGRTKISCRGSIISDSWNNTYMSTHLATEHLWNPSLQIQKYAAKTIKSRDIINFLNVFRA